MLAHGGCDSKKEETRDKKKNSNPIEEKRHGKKPAKILSYSYPITKSDLSILPRAVPPRTMLAFALPLLLGQVPGYGVPNYTVTYEMSRSTVVRAWRGAAGLAAARRSHALLCP